MCLFFRPRSIRWSPIVHAIASLALLCAVPMARAESSGQPLALDTQSGISDGHSGIILQTAPLSHQPIVEASPMAAPSELAPSSSTPMVVAPYIGLSTGRASGAQQPMPLPRSRQ
jgi:hypothetical protein